MEKPHGYKTHVVYDCSPTMQLLFPAKSGDKYPINTVMLNSSLNELRNYKLNMFTSFDEMLPSFSYINYNNDTVLHHQYLENFDSFNRKKDVKEILFLFTDFLSDGWYDGSMFYLLSVLQGRFFVVAINALPASIPIKRTAMADALRVKFQIPKGIVSNEELISSAGNHFEINLPVLSLHSLHETRFTQTLDTLFAKQVEYITESLDVESDSLTEISSIDGYIFEVFYKQRKSVEMYAEDIVDLFIGRATKSAKSYAGNCASTLLGAYSLNELANKLSIDNRFSGKFYWDEPILEIFLSGMLRHIGINDEGKFLYQLRDDCRQILIEKQKKLFDDDD